MHWLKQLVSRRRRYDDIAVSIEEHIAERAEELIESGMARPQAEQTARREFGNVALLQQRSREVWQWPAAESLLADAKLALRRLRKAPGFAVTVLLTLAIGIGANTAVFTVVNSVLLRPLPYPDSDRLVALWLNAPGAGGLASFSSGLQLSSSMFLTFSEHNQTFQSMGIWSGRLANVTGLAQPEQVRVGMVSDGILETLAVAPAVGRWFSQADQDPRGAQTVMLSYGYWQRHFGRDASVIGRTLQVDARPRTIIGVMPRGFRLVDQDFDLLGPLMLDRTNQKLAGFGYYGIGRLRPGVSLAQADADIARLLPVWMDSWTNGPGSNPHYYKVWRIAPAFRTLKAQVIGNIGSVLWVVMATVGVVMLIACTNVANLMLVRAEARQHELSIRAALGAGRSRIARSMLTESVMLGLLGGALSMAVAYAGLKLLVRLGPQELPRLSEVSLDARSLAFTVFLSLLSGVLFGSIPAWRYANAKASQVLRDANRTASAGRLRHRSRNVLVVAQVAMAMVLLVSALLMIRTFSALRDVQPGFEDPAHVQTVRISIPDTLISDPVMVTRTQNEIADRIASIAGVKTVGFASAVPMTGDDPNWDEIRVEGKVYQGGEPPLRLYNYVGPGFFKAMGTHVVAGRDFTWTDLYNLRPMVMVSEGFARENWGSSAAAVGKRLRQFSASPWQEVIGVVEDVHHHGLDEKAPPTIYWSALLRSPYTPQPTIDGPRSVTFAIRTDRAGNENFLNEVQRTVWSVNGDLPLAAVQTMQAVYAASMARTSFTLVMLSIAGSMALALGVIGIYGVISYAISQRTREIGIRMALGAQKNALKWMFVRTALMLTLLGIAIGIAAAAALAHGMKALLFGISPLDPMTYAVVPLVLGAAAIAASYLPARRAATVNPVEALRAE